MQIIRVLLVDGDETMCAIRQEILSRAVLDEDKLELTAVNKLPKQIGKFDLIIIDAQLLQPEIEQNLLHIKKNTQASIMLIYNRFDTVKMARKILNRPAGLFNTDNLDWLKQKWIPKIFYKAKQH